MRSNSASCAAARATEATYASRYRFTTGSENSDLCRRMPNHTNAALPAEAKIGACLCRFSLENVGLRDEGCRHIPARIAANFMPICILQLVSPDRLAHQ